MVACSRPAFLQELAYKLVSKMGWEEGKGLGKDNKGIVKHIWTKKRNDQVGLGGEVGNDWGAHSIQTNSYNSLLSKLAVITNNSDSDSDSDAETKAKKKKATKNGKKDKQGAKESGSDSEAKAQKKSKNDKKKKKKKKDSSDSDSSDEDLSKAASASCDDYGGARKAGRSYAAAAAKEIKEKKAQTNALRFAYKRAHLNKTKDVKAYSATDLSQILGFSVAPKGEEDKRLLTRDGVKSYGKAGAKMEDSSSDDESEKEKTSKKCKKDAAPEKPKGGIVIGSSKRKPMVLPEPSKLTGVLMHMFSHGGFLSGETKQKEQDWQFDEATQEKIAMDAHNNKVTGKKGLGFDNDRPTKLGKDYTGSKKRFEESDDEKDKAEGESEDESEAERKARRKAEKKAKKAAAAAAAEEEEEASEKKKKKKKKRAKGEEEEEEEEKEEPSEEVPDKKKKKKQKAE